MAMMERPHKWAHIPEDEQIVAPDPWLSWSIPGDDHRCSMPRCLRRSVAVLRSPGKRRWLCEPHLLVRRRWIEDDVVVTWERRN